jgi:hypothetical protein
MKEIFCAYCGRNTYDVDIEYLIGGNHLSCVLMDQLSDALENEKKMNKKKPMEIKNWTKLNSQKFDVMGASFVIMDTRIDNNDTGNIYSAWVYPYNDSEAFLRVTLFSNDMQLQIKVLPPGQFTHLPMDLTTTITKVHLSNPSIFIQTICEGLLDDPTARNMIEFIGRKQDETRRKKGTGYSPGAGISGSSGNNLW